MLQGTEGGQNLWKMGEGIRIGRESKEATGRRLRYKDIQEICNG